MRTDLAWWLFSLQEGNGVLFFLHGSSFVHGISDASGSFGYGVIVPDWAWFDHKWLSCWSAQEITVKGLLPVMLAAVLWDHTGPDV